MNKGTTLKLNKDFKRLYYRGKSEVHPLVVTYGQKNRLGYNRTGITVSKKLGSAVLRNRCKRVIREGYRQLEPELPQGWDFVFVARSRTATAKSTQLSAVLRRQIRSLTSPKGQQKGKAAGLPAEKKAGGKNKQNSPKENGKRDKKEGELG